jgi:iron complex outermembrane receptor protein
VRASLRPCAGVAALWLLPLAVAPLGAQDTAHVARAATPLAPIVVSANRTAAPVDSLPSATTALDAQMILRGHPGVGLDELLSGVPGLVVNNRFNPAQDQTLSVRGFGARAAFGVRGVTILVDGIPQTLPDGQSQISGVELSDVTRVEVLRGAAASLYGNGAGGVISLSTEGPTPSAPGGRAAATGGAFGLVKLLAGASAPLGGGGLWIDASRTTSAGYRAHGSAHIGRLDARLTAPLGRFTQLITTLDATDQPTLEDPGALTAAELDSNPRMASPRNLAVDAGKDVSQTQLAFTVQHRGAAGATFDATVYGLRRNLHNRIATTVIDLGRWVGGARLSGTVPFVLGGRSHAVTVGLDVQGQRDDRQNHDYTGALTLDQLEHVRSLGPFAHAIVHLPARLTLSAGARYDRLTFRANDRLLSNGDQSGSRVLAAPSGSLGLSAALAPALTVFTDVGTSFETPTTTELANRPDGTGGFNASLQPQRARQLEAGARIRTRTAAFDVAVYATRVTDELIPFQVPGQAGRTFYRNAGSATHRGFEASARLRPVAWATVEVAYTYTHLRFDTFRTAADTLDGNAIPGVPVHSGYVALRLARGVFWLTTDATWRTRTWADDANTVTAKGWAVTGVYAGIDVAARGLLLGPSVGVTNLFDAHYAANVVVNAAAGRYFEPGASRAVFAGLRLRW